MRTRSLEPFGTEVWDLAIAERPQSRAPELRHLIASSRVVVFRDQEIDDDGFVNFLTALGALTFTLGEVAVPGMPSLNVISNVGRTEPPRSVFHTDTSYVAVPPAFTALRPVALPAGGGATLVSDQVGVVARLPAELRDAISGRTVLHRATGLRGQTQATRHPLLRRHPITGEIALYLSTPERCIDCSGMDAERSARAIAELYARSTEASALYRHEWRVGDILIWDNRVTMHRADHDGVTGDRILHRGMVAGERPIAA